MTEDSASRVERERDEALSKGHVLYEGISGHILTYDRKQKDLVALSYFLLCCFQLTLEIILIQIAHTLRNTVSIFTEIFVIYRLSISDS